MFRVRTTAFTLFGHAEVAMPDGKSVIVTYLRAPGDCDHLFQLIATRRSN
jgi:hypothetical protein